MRFVNSERAIWWFRATGVLAVISFILVPSDAWAWGPVAHLDFSLHVIASAAALLPAAGRLISDFRDDFLYGGIVADMVVGKNLARDKEHCHSWEVARALALAARDVSEQTEAMVLGYIGHLAADVVAHNHFVPGRIVANYRAMGVGHLYWEARFDQKLLDLNGGIRAIWEELSKRRFRDHDQFLRRRITPTLFSHRISHGLFRRSLDVQRRPPWQGTFRQIDSRSKMPLGVEEVEKWRMAAISVMSLAFSDFYLTRVDHLDPTGLDALRVATSMRRALRRQQRRFSPEDKLLESTTPSVPPPSFWNQAL